MWGRLINPCLVRPAMAHTGSVAIARLSNRPLQACSCARPKPRSGGHGTTHPLTQVIISSQLHHLTHQEPSNGHDTYLAHVLCVCASQRVATTFLCCVIQSAHASGTNWRLAPREALEYHLLKVCDLRSLRGHVLMMGHNQSRAIGHQRAAVYAANRSLVAIPLIDSSAIANQCRRRRSVTKSIYRPMCICSYYSTIIIMYGPTHGSNATVQDGGCACSPPHTLCLLVSCKGPAGSLATLRERRLEIQYVHGLALRGYTHI